MDLLTVTGLVGVLALALHTLRGPPIRPVPGACERLDWHLRRNLVGQSPAIGEAVSAVCAHLADNDPAKPLVISVHGPPGVGKSMLHRLMAEALFNLTEQQHDCPGWHCPAYKVVFGMDFTEDGEEAQYSKLKGELLDHFRAFQTALVAIEEFDKASCRSLNFIRHLIVHGASSLGRLALNRSIIILESNSGYLKLMELLRDAGDREKVDLVLAGHVLKDDLFYEAVNRSCFTHVEGNRFVNVIDLFLPFFPLRREHIGQAAGIEIAKRARTFVREGKLQKLEWEPSVESHIAAKIFYDEEFAVEGASGLRMTVSKEITKALRQWDPTLLLHSETAPKRNTKLKLTVSNTGEGLAVVTGESSPSLTSEPHSKTLET